MKDFKRCPRCNFKTPASIKRCGNCGLDYNKFNSATNTEAKSAFRMNEKERILYSKQVPSDVNKTKILLMCIFGGWFGLHYFKIGRIWRGIIQALGVVFGFVYTFFAVERGVTTGYLGLMFLLLGFVWAYTFVSWIIDIVSIVFNKFKYPVSLPYVDAGKGE